jgi:internalin A
MELLQRLQEWVQHELDRSGCRDWNITTYPEAPRSARPPKAGHRGPAQPEPEDAVAEPPLTFSPPPSRATTYCVSYAWNDQSKAVVDRLCEESTRRGITILRDTTGMGLGESITRFMQRLGAGDRVFVILSDKYMKSPYCMYELLDVWRNCMMEPDAFLGRIRVFRLPDAAMLTTLERARCAKYWKEQFTELDTYVREHGPTLLGEMDFKRYKLMQDFAHRVGDVLALIADTLQPTDFDQLIAYGFGDGAPPISPQ